MAFYVVQYHAGICGTDYAEKVEADSEQEAIDILMPDAESWFWNFNDEEDFEDVEPELDIWAEEYNPAKHDDILT